MPAATTTIGTGDILQLTVGAQLGCTGTLAQMLTQEPRPCLRLTVLYLACKPQCWGPHRAQCPCGPLCLLPHLVLCTRVCVCPQGRLLYREGPTATTAELHVSPPRGSDTRVATPPRVSGADTTTTIVDTTGAVQLSAGNSGSGVGGVGDVGSGGGGDSSGDSNGSTISGGDAVKVYYLPEDDIWYLKTYYRSMSVISLVGAGCEGMCHECM